MKDQRSTLERFLGHRGPDESSWDQLSACLSTTTTSVAENGIVVPASCLDHDVAANKVVQLYQAIFQPHIMSTTDTIMTVPAFNALIDQWERKGTHTAPLFSKGVSYPSHLRGGKARQVIASDNVWMLDLFTRGVTYTRQMGDAGSYLVVDTTFYEGWNRFAPNEIVRLTTGLPSSNAGETLIARYFELMHEPKYAFLIENIRTRGRYAAAICDVVGLRAPVTIEEMMVSDEYSKHLSALIDRVGAPDAFSKRGKENSDYYVREFSPCVYAEELVLRETQQVDAYLGPIREELPLGVNVRGWHELMGTTPTPLAWYTRPNKFPELDFDTNCHTVSAILRHPDNSRLVTFLGESLVRLDRLENRIYGSDDATEVVFTLVELMREVREALENPTKRRVA